MSVTISPVANNQSFGTWLGRTNQLTTIMSTNVVSTDNTVSGGITSGNGTVNGYFGSNTFNIGINDSSTFAFYYLATITTQGYESVRYSNGLWQRFDYLGTLFPR